MNWIKTPIVKQGIWRSEGNEKKEKETWTMPATMLGKHMNVLSSHAS
jgi:hypothetical protein